MCGHDGSHSLEFGGGNIMAQPEVTKKSIRDATFIYRLPQKRGVVGNPFQRGGLGRTRGWPLVPLNGPTKPIGQTTLVPPYG